MAAQESVPGGAAVGASLNVVGLEANVTNLQLYDLFSQIGEVTSVKVCRDFSSGLSILHGYVSYRNPKCALRALEELNFTPLNGKLIRITCSHLEPSTNRSGDGTVYIENSESEIDHEALPEKFLSFENTESRNPGASCQSMGNGYVQLSDEESVQKGTKEHNCMLSEKKQVSTGPSFSTQKIQLSADKANFTNVYVKNFCKSTTEDDLKNIFGEFGWITSTVVMRNQDGTSKCYGMVNFENAEDAARAVESLNGKIIGKKKWYVGRALKKLERQLQLECVKEAFDNGSNLYVNNLDCSIGDEKLKELFSVFGSVISCTVLRNEQGKSRVRGLVAFSSPEEASEALSRMNGKVAVGKPLYIAIAQRKEDRRAPLQNLGKKIDDKPLPEAFSSSGGIHCKVAKDASHHLKGCDFVQLAGEVTGQKAIGEIDGIVRKFNVVVTKLNGIIGELNEVIGELNGLLLNEKQVHMECSLTKERELLEDKANLTNVLVKNFCESTTEEDLKKILGEFGLVKDTVVMRNEDGTSKCFGFVNFENAEDAARVVESLNGQIFNKKTWYVGIDRKSFKRELTVNHHLEPCVNEVVDKGSKLFVDNQDYSIGHGKLSDVFSPNRSLKSCKVKSDRNGIRMGSGFIALSLSLSEKNSKLPASMHLHIAHAQRKEDRRAWLQCQPGFGYENRLFPGVQPARPIMHSMSVLPIQKDPWPASAMKQQILPRGHGYHCLPESMISVCRLLLCDVGISQSSPVGALASSLANASPLNRGRFEYSLIHNDHAASHFS